MPRSTVPLPSTSADASNHSVLGNTRPATYPPLCLEVCNHHRCDGLLSAFNGQKRISKSQGRRHVKASEWQPPKRGLA